MVRATGCPNDIGRGGDLEGLFDPAFALSNPEVEDEDDADEVSSLHGAAPSNEVGLEEDDMESISMASALDGMSIGLESLSLFDDVPRQQQQQQQAALAYESASTRVYRLRDTERKLCKTSDFVAVKTLCWSAEVTKQEQELQLRKLKNEFQILTQASELSKLPSVRAALLEGTYQDKPALYLEWAHGISLENWISSAHNAETLTSVLEDEGQGDEGNDSEQNDATKYEIKRSLRLAWEIARAVGQMHSVGIAHNNLSAHNIIVNEEKGEDAALTIKLIDFSNATTLQQSSANDDTDKTTKATQNDIYCLGIIFYQIFSGIHPLRINQDAPLSSFSTIVYSSSTNAIPSLHQLNPRFPQVLSDLVSNLISTSSDCNKNEDQLYQTANEVDKDLYIMLVDPDRFLFHSHPQHEKIRFSHNKLYGRSTHITSLMNAYNRVIVSGGTPEMVLVAGRSGSGKSALVQLMREPITRRGGYFLAGKFDSLRQCEPLSAILDAFAEYTEELIHRRNPEDLNRIRKAIMESVGSVDGCVVLAESIPALRQLLFEDDNAGSHHIPSSTYRTAATTIEAKNRFQYVFRTFVRAIVSPRRPLVLFLDDLQWADAASLDLIQVMVTDTQTRSLLFLGCYRDNEVSDSHIFSAAVRQIQDQKIPITNIQVDNISKEDVYNLILDTLNLDDPTEARELASVVHRKTSGTPMFVIQFLMKLVDFGALQYSFRSKSWLVNEDAVKSCSVANNAVDLIIDKILRLPNEVKAALKLVACFGSHCDRSLLRLVATGVAGEIAVVTSGGTGGEGGSAGDPELMRMLEFAVHEGLMDKVGSIFRFSHDQIQLAAYSLIPEAERGGWHLRIGTLLLENASPSVLEEILFIVVDQLNRGRSFMEDNVNKCTELAKLNMRAGKKAISSTMYKSAANYLKEGTINLPPNHWCDHYELSLDLYCCYAETQHCNGNFSELTDAVQLIVENSRCFYDKLRAFATLVDALIAQEKAAEAADLGFDVLAHLGESFPESTPDDAMTFADYTKTREMMEEKTDHLLNLPLMQDKSKIAAMQFLKSMFFCTYFFKPALLPMTAFRMTQVCLSHGICKESPFAFASFGMFSCIFGDIKAGYRYGQLAMGLLERLKGLGQESFARVYVSVYAGISIWNEHIKLSLEPLLQGYRCGLRVGDMEYSMANVQTYCTHSYQCGKELSSLEKELKTYSQQMLECKQVIVGQLTTIHRQAVLNLMGRSKDPMELTGDAMDQEVLLRDATENKNSLLVCLVYYHRMRLAYTFGDHHLAADMAERSRDIDKKKPSTIEVWIHAFYDGLIALSLARETKQMKWMFIADQSIEKLKNWSRYAPSNFQHQLVLLEAEYAFFMGKKKKASTAFELSISLARQNGFIQDQALACERASIFFLEYGDNSKASNLYGEAHNCYLTWGAKGKADQLREQSPF